MNHDNRTRLEPIGYHVILSLEDRRPIATTEAELRTLARVLLAQGERRGLLAYGPSDDHLHSLLATDRRSAGMFARYVATALGWQLQLGAKFRPAIIKPLSGQDHAYNAFHYIHGQAAHHGLSIDPFREGTSIHDHLGIRIPFPSTSIITRVRTRLPKVKRGHLTDHLWPGALDGDGPIDINVLASAAAAAVAIPDLRTQSFDSARARRAAVHVAGPAVSTADLSDILQICSRAVRVLRAAPKDPALVRAVELQCRLRTTPVTTALRTAG